MSKTVINKRSQIIWDNGFAPDGQSLPKVSTTDAGKVLTVDEEGKWSAGEASGGTEYTAGDNIQISADNVISATDTTYTAGTGISISAGNVISADSQLPSVTSADEGKVLKVDSNGDWAVGTDDDTKYTAGTNVQINGSVISATDTTYTAGANVQINDGVISATDTTYTAGTNVQINNGVISATDTTYTAGNGITITGTSIAADAQLPTVSSTDEGKVLKVDGSGNWAIGTDNDTTYTAGSNVQINNGVISATDTTYSAGANISINAQNEISATDTKYIAGANITIDANNEISATDTTYSAGSGISISGTVISADAQLPSVSLVDEGKVLKVDNTGAWAVGSDDNTTYSAGTNISIDANNQISAVDTTYSAGTGITITGTTIAADSQLPSYSATENGKVLSVDSNGDLEWATPSGGGASILMPDKANKIKNQTTISGGGNTNAYTATQDCFVEVAWNVTNVSSGAEFRIYLYKLNAVTNALTMFYQKYAPSSTGQSGGGFTFPLKKDWTVNFYSGDALSNSYYTVYGIA